MSREMQSYLKTSVVLCRRSSAGELMFHRCCVLCDAQLPRSGSNTMDTATTSGTMLAACSVPHSNALRLIYQSTTDRYLRRMPGIISTSIDCSGTTGLSLEEFC